MTAFERRLAARREELEGLYMSLYCFDGPDIPREMEKTIPDVFPATAPGSFIYVPEMGKYVCSSFHPYQWDLNYKNPAVFNDMVSAMLALANMGVEVLRVDATPYLWKEMGTICRNLHRTAFNWENAARRTQPGTVQQRVWDGLRQLEHIRSADPCFGPDAWVTTWDAHNDHVLALVRRTDGETLVCLFNFTGEEQSVSLNALPGEYTDLLTGETARCDRRTLAPYQYSLCRENR